MLGGKLEEGHPREYVHTHMNVHMVKERTHVKKGEEEMSRPTVGFTYITKTKLKI
jgi:hypothetical protein